MNILVGGGDPGAINLIEDKKELSVGGKKYKFKTRNELVVVDRISNSKTL